MRTARYIKILVKKLISSIYSWLTKVYWQNYYDCIRNKYEVPKSFKFNGYGIIVHGEGAIQFGESSYIGSNSYIQSELGRSVTLGAYCAISHNVRIYTSSYVADQDFSFRNRKKKSGNVVIGDAVWIGANVLINPGVVIGKNSVIGANSVVTKDIPEGSICGGVPAKIIRYKSFD